MRWMSRAVAIAAVLTPTLAAASFAQRLAAAAQQPASPAMTGPKWSAFAGIASGDNPYDVGVALGGNGIWRRSDWPVGIRGDAYFAHHGGSFGSQLGGVDLSINIFGVMGAAQYDFPTENKLKPYAFGGLGLFYSNVSVDYNGVFSNDGAYDSSTDLGFGIGGGLSFTQKFGVEIRFMDIGGFNTIPILAVLHF